MQKSGSLGALLQGVSQQPAAIRQDGKVREQINFVSDVVQGLTSRPSAKHLAYLTDKPAGLRFQEIDLDDGTYEMAYKAGHLSITDQAGTEYACTFEGDTLSYVGDDMSTYVYDNVAYLTNRDTITARSTVVDPTNSLITTPVGAVLCLGGLFSRTYTVTLLVGTTTIKGSYSTPDGTTAGDAAKATSTNIVSRIANSLRAHVDWPAGGTIAVVDNISTIFIELPTEFTLTVDDGDNNQSLRGYTTRTNDTTNLSEYAPHGMLVKITGVDEGVEDDYYLRFNADTTEVVGEGFGTPGVWEEWHTPDEPSGFDLTTMPHVLRKEGAGFILGQGPWKPRRVGDDETVPFPDFIGHSIRDIGGFQSRLVFVGGPWLSTSRTNKPTDFFKKSALIEVSDDPISITSTKEGAVRIDWIVEFDLDLILLSDPGDGQFLVSGGQKLTPGNASMAQTTSFEMRGNTRPVKTGKTILFPFRSGLNTGINEFFANTEVTSNGVDTLTETLDRYIVGGASHMVCSTNFNMFLITTDDPAFSNTIWVYKYLWQGADKAQSAWSKWTFPYNVVGFYFSDSDLYVTLFDPITANYSKVTMDLDRTADLVVGYPIMVDCSREVMVTGNAVTFPIKDAVFVQYTGCNSPGAVAASISMVDAGDGMWTYSFRSDHIPEGATLIGGAAIPRSVSPTMPFMRDRTGNIVPRTKLTVTDFFIEYEDTSYLEVQMSSKYREDTSVTVDWFPLEGDPEDPDETGLRSGIFEAPWGERADWSTLTIKSSDIRPTTLIELQWAGSPYQV